jgi:predicted enzyme related to lactoylglutathione lyase
MSEVRSYEAGMPAWVDLTTSDPEGSRRFYEELFGWQFQAGPAETGHYITCLVRGHMVAGLAGDPAPAGTPAAWTTYLASGDLDDTVSRITAAGGRLTTEPTDVPDLGRMAVAVAQPGRSLASGKPANSRARAWPANRAPSHGPNCRPAILTWRRPSTRRYSATTGRRPPAGCGTRPSQLAAT